MKWKNIAIDTSLFFITTTINGWQPLFNYDTPRQILLEDFAFYRKKYNAKIHAYVIMPEHYHMVLSLNDSAQLHNWLRDLHSHTANEISKWLRGDGKPEESAIKQIISILRERAEKKSELTVWKEQTRAVGITSERILRIKIEYIHANPVRRGLVKDVADWPWSSLRNYYLDDEGVLTVDRIEI